jgi:hypothetical protein
MNVRITAASDSCLPCAPYPQQQPSGRRVSFCKGAGLGTH